MRAGLGQWMRRAGVDDATHAAVLVAATEATSNAIEHAYSPGTGDVSVEADLRDGIVEVRVRDHGTWRRARSVGGGMGLQLMRRLVDDVRVSSTDAGTTVRLLVALPDGRPPAR